ncbi:MAG TPA: hypothetical protein VGO92_14010, partial [Acidimicrobiales bacterium]|nr:hypothetical protein [Acidimicrobiales bacterium]
MSFAMVLLYPSVPHFDPFRPQAAGLFGLVAGDEHAVGPYHPPPRQPVDALGHEVPHRPCRARPTRLQRNLAVGDHLAGLQRRDDPDDPLLELCHLTCHGRTPRGLVHSAQYCALVHQR